MPSSKELKRQLAFHVPKADWRAVQIEARRRRITVPDLLREWVAEPIKRLRENEIEKTESKEGSDHQ